MPISVACKNGHKLTAKDKLAGKRVRCPKCQVVMQIPDVDASPAIPFAVEVNQPAPDPRSESDRLGDLPDLDGLDLGNVPGAPVPGAPVPGAPVPGAPVPGAPVAENPPDVPASESFNVASPVASEASSFYAPEKTEPVAIEEGRSNDNKQFLWIVSGIGGVLGLLLVAMLGWVLFDGGEDSSSVIATSETSSKAGTISGPVPTKSPGNSSGLGASTSATASEPSNAPPERTFDLIPMQVSQLEAFSLPGPTWSSAYDEATGRIALTNDEKQGVLIYDVDDILDGKLGLIETLPTKGLPCSVCLKVTPERRLFVISAKEQPDLTLIATDTLKQVGHIALEGFLYARQLSSSHVSTDPYVYFQTHSREGLQRSEPDFQELEDIADRVGRVSIVDGTQSELSANKFPHVDVSPDGRLLFAHIKATATQPGRFADWEDIVRKAPTGQRQTLQSEGISTTQAPVFTVGNDLVWDYGLYEGTLGVRKPTYGFTPMARFPGTALAVGLNQEQLSFCSANDYRPYASIPIPKNWAREKRAGSSVDFRFRKECSRYLDSHFFRIEADSSRDCAILTLSNKLILVRHDQFKLPNEPSLDARQPRTNLARVGKPMVWNLELEHSEATNVQFEYVPNSNWLPDEKTPVLGLAPPGVPFPRPLELRFGFGKTDDDIQLKSHALLKNRKFPFLLRIGQEVVKVTGRRQVQGRFAVERKHRLSHGFSERVAILDDDGNDISTPTPEPEGKKLYLEASVNASQTKLYVQNTKTFAGASLPIDIRIGEEKMQVVSVDDFDDTLIVQRSESIAHRVTEAIYVLEEPSESSAPNLPQMDGNRLTWTPALSQIGRHTIRIRANAGKYTKEFFWQVEVTGDTLGIPFLVRGIESHSNGKLAVIWGHSRFPHERKNIESKLPPIEHFIGIYDLQKRTVLRQSKLPFPVDFAALNDSGVYASKIQYDITNPSPRKTGPSQIVRLDLSTLQVIDEVPTPVHTGKLTIIGDRYLAAFAQNQNLRFKIPQLEALESKIQKCGYPVFGQLQDGWLFDGVVYNSAFRKPRLLLFPVHFEKRHAEAVMSLAGDGSIFMHRSGASLGTWSPQDKLPTVQHQLANHPGGLRCVNGELQYFSFAERWRRRADGGRPRPSKTFRLLPSEEWASKRRDRGVSSRSVDALDYVTATEDTAYAAVEGQLYSVPLVDLIGQQSPTQFQFVEQQDTFVLNPKGPNTLTYSAPGAASYELKIWRQRPGIDFFHHETPLVEAKSKSGVFKINQHALDSDQTGQAPNGMTAASVTAAYKALTGKTPRGLVAPLYVSVVATHNDGQQKIGLAHAYLVEYRQ